MYRFLFTCISNKRLHTATRTHVLLSVLTRVQWTTTLSDWGLGGGEIGEDLGWGVVGVCRRYTKPEGSTDSSVLCCYSRPSIDLFSLSLSVSLSVSLYLFLSLWYNVFSLSLSLSLSEMATED